ncbi:MAG TPA: alpha/beta fold hydrolase [Actinomycetota bacterium]|nr:alpha/beta fold hydrolase [Actinomycetota bacterium]
MSELDFQRVELSVGEVAYADEGDGPPVVLLHGFPTSSHLWRDLLPMLSVRMRALAPDLPGYGASERRAEADSGIPALAAAVRELLDHLGIERAALVGHDIGGAIAQILALEGRAEALVVIDGVTIGVEPSEPMRVLQATPDRLATPELAELTVRTAFDLGMGQRARLPEEELEVFLRPWREDPPALLRAARALTETGLDGRREDLAALDIPAFVVWGEDDAFLPARHAEELWETLPDAGIALLPGCGHYVTEDAAETVLPLVSQFLRNRYLGQPGHDHAGGPVPVDLGVSFTRPDPPHEFVEE